jgi:hypothetical protein
MIKEMKASLVVGRTGMDRIAIILGIHALTEDIILLGGIKF